MWIAEAHTSNDVYHHGVNRIIHSERTEYQDMVICDVGPYGHALFLDGALQTSEGDEAYYHEPIVHAACVAVGGAPQSVLILGGGDGGTAREVLRWKSVQRVVNVELDQRVVDACREHLPKLSQGAFDDSRLTLVIDDAQTYLQQSQDKFDVIVCDLTDPIEHGPSAKLFVLEFFTSLRNHLSDNNNNNEGGGGAIVLQSGTLSLAENDINLTRIVKTLKQVFADVNVMQTFTPKYGGPLALTMATTKPLQLPSADDIDRMFEAGLSGDNFMLDGRAVHGLFAIPKCVRDNLRRHQKILMGNDHIKLPGHYVDTDDHGHKQ